MMQSPNRHVVQSYPGEQTTDGSDGYVRDNHGKLYRVVSAAEAASIRNSTGGTVATLHRDGRIT